jgi:hypothetical protein
VVAEVTGEVWSSVVIGGLNIEGVNGRAVSELAAFREWRRRKRKRIKGARRARRDKGTATATAVNELELRQTVREVASVEKCEQTV